MADDGTETQLEGIIFDLGGVVLDWSPRYLFRKVFAGNETRMEQFLAEICPSAWNEQQDFGRSLSVATAERVALFPDWEAEIRAYYSRWPEMIAGPVPGTSSIMQEAVAQGLRLFALSNWSGETYPLVSDAYLELRLFEKLYLSGHYGYGKPDERFFRMALEDIAIPIHKLVFVDDNLTNVAAARGLGLRALHFRDAERLREELGKMGVDLSSTVL